MIGSVQGDGITSLHSPIVRNENAKIVHKVLLALKRGTKGLTAMIAGIRGSMAATRTDLGPLSVQSRALQSFCFCFSTN